MAGISKVELEAYARLIADAQKEAGRRARRLVSQWMAQHPKATAEEVRNAAIDIVAAVSDEYGNAAASAACDLYDTTMAAEGLDLPNAEPVTESTRADVERAVRYQLRKWLDGDEAAFLDAMDDAAQYYARRQANRTTISNCERDSRYYSPGGLGTAQANRRYGPLAQATAFYGSSRGGTRNPRRGRRHSLHAGDIAYARVPTGAETCTYCMMLASRGFAYRSEQSAGHADHRGCNCLIVAGVHGSTTVEGVDLAEQYDTWKEMATADARHDAGELSDEEWRAQKRAIVDSHPNATAGIDAAPGREGGNTGERVGWYVPQEYEGYGGSPSVEYLRSSRARP